MHLDADSPPPDVVGVRDALRAQQLELKSFLEVLDDSDWRRPSSCAGWSIGDVVVHLIQSDELAVASAERRLDLPAPRSGDTNHIDSLAELGVRRSGTATAAELFERWTLGADHLLGALDRVDPSDRLKWVVGDLSARTLTTTRLTETWIHTNDIADGLSLTVAPTNRLWHVARLAWRTIPYALEREGHAPTGTVGLDLVGPFGDSWQFGLEAAPTTVIRGGAFDLCRVAARRTEPAATTLVGTGPDAARVLSLIRTWA